MTDTSLLFVFATPISSMTGACGETRQSITIPSRLPLSSPHLPCVFITLCPRHFLSITLNLLAFLPLFLSPFIPHVDSHCLLIRYPLLSLQQANSWADGEKERGSMSFGLRCFILLSTQTHFAKITARHKTGSSKPEQSHNKCYTVLCGILLTVALSHYGGRQDAFLGSFIC